MKMRIISWSTKNRFFAGKFKKKREKYAFANLFEKIS